MPILDLIEQSFLDEAQLCPHCRAAMHYVEGEYHQKTLKYHYCQHCEHHVYYGQNGLPCVCQHCLAQRNQHIKQTKAAEIRNQNRKRQYATDPIVIDQLSLMEKLFVLALLQSNPAYIATYQGDTATATYRDFIDLNVYTPQSIAPSYQLFHYLKKQALAKHYFMPVKTAEVESDDDHSALYFCHLRLVDYPDPSLHTLLLQLQEWFVRHHHCSVPYRSVDEVKTTLLTLLAHELLHYAQFYCQTLGVRFYGNQKLMVLFEQLLGRFAVTQLYHLTHRALTYLHQQQLLQIDNQDFINTNLLKKTLEQYAHLTKVQGWETPNRARPTELPISQMTHVFFYQFLQLADRAFEQPLWKCWQDIAPRLQFFEHHQCMHCGSQDLRLNYRDDHGISFTCRSCRQQSHYFVR